MKRLLCLSAAVFAISALVLACGHKDGGGGGAPANRQFWTWVSGSDVGNQSGVYGIKGFAFPSNMPGSRDKSVTWTDGSGNLWLFGGFGRDSAGLISLLNDLWKFDGSAWTWVGGANIVNQPGVYGAKGVAFPSNLPGARESAVSWIDGSGNVWLFGGYGYDSTGGFDDLNDLWKFDGSAWTWVGGSNIVYQPGVYGTKGVASPSNVPGARESAVSWTDGSGNVWLFGGYGRDSAIALNILNDLWKFDGSAWTWVSGSNIASQPGVYGAKGVASPSNTPGARYGAVSWIDGSGDLWLFGGDGKDSTGGYNYLNDLWKFDGSNWTWVSGANIVSQPGVYGMKGIPSSGTVPGARNYAVSWTDGNGDLWLFGGYGRDSAGTLGRLNDLMRFNTQ